MTGMQECEGINKRRGMGGNGEGNNLAPIVHSPGCVTSDLLSYLLCKRCFAFKGIVSGLLELLINT